MECPVLPNATRSLSNRGLGKNVAWGIEDEASATGTESSGKGCGGDGSYTL